MLKIKKRDNTLQDFEIKKIEAAIEKAFMAEHKIYTHDIIEMLALRVVAQFNSKVKDGIVELEDVQDAVEVVLVQAGFVDVAKSYIVYRKQRENVRQITSTSLDYASTVNQYLKIADWRVKENSTVTYSVGGLILSNSGAVTANYWLSEIYDPEICNAHKDADIHIHDLSMLTGYCAGWSLKQLIKEGLGGVVGKITSTPATHLSTLCNQMVNFLGIMQNEWAGAQAFSSFDTYLAPFVKKDNLTYKEVKQCIQSFVYGVNTPSRWGTQAPFTNITLDWVVPNDMAELNAIVGGVEQDFKYKDCVKEMAMVNKAFIEIMIEGDANGRGFQYPIPTYSITKNFDWSETENNKLLFEMTAKYGTPYFSNYINSDMEPSDVRSMCPLTHDTIVLIKNKNTEKVMLKPIQKVYNTLLQHPDTKYEVWTGAKWADAKPIQVPKTKIYEIQFSNGTSVKMGENHLQPTKDFGTLHADELKVGMWIPFNKNEWGTALGDFDLGYIIGAYAGDGSHDENAIIYSLDRHEKDDLTVSKLITIWQRLGFDCNVSINDKVRFVRINGNAYGLVKDYIDGTDALTKEFTHKVFNMSVEFKKGILAGMNATDGCREKKRYYTSSVKLKDEILYLLSSMGQKAISNYVDTRDCRLGKNPNYRIDNPGQTNYGKLFNEDDKYFYYQITNITEVTNDSDYLYCFEVDSEDHVFALASGLITHNCRLRLDLRELRKKSGGFFGSGESTGSVGVVTINMPRIAYLSTDKKDFFVRLDKLMNLSARSLKIKRDTITKFLEAGLYPYTKRYLGTFANHFSTIGLVGMNEACLNARWIKKDLTHKEAVEFTKEVLNHMREKLSDYQELYGDLYNLEATPAESTSYRLARHDKKRYPDIITASENGRTPYYTNSSHLPVSFTDDVFTALDIQDELQTLYTSGTVFHTFLGEKLPDWKSCMNLVRKIAENYHIPYYTMSPTYSVCANHGYITGEVPVCPICAKKTEIYSRITGYYRPVQNWNEGKLEEFNNRKEYVPETSVLNPKHKHCALDNDLNDKPSLANITIFTTKTCPNCKMAKMLLEKAGIKFDIVDAEDNKDITIKFGVKKAPTLLVPNGDKFDVYENVSNIKGYIENR